MSECMFSYVDDGHVDAYKLLLAYVYVCLTMS